MMFSSLSQMVSRPSIAVDLGTANTRVSVFGDGMIVEKPSSINLVNDHANGVADDYFRYINSTLVTSPLRGGVIVDLKKTVTLLKPLILQARKLFMRPISLACAPTDTSEGERDLLCRALVQAGASRVSVIPEVWAAAVGAGMDVTLPTAQLLVDIGEGVTDMAVFRDGRIMYTSAVRTACGDIHKAVRSALMAKYKMKIYDPDVERLTSKISAILSRPDRQCDPVTVTGIDVMKRCEGTITIDGRDIVDAVIPVLCRITDMISSGLKKIPEKSRVEIGDCGICLTGGGACIEGLDILIALRTGVGVKVAQDPIHAVINGAMQTLHQWNGSKCWWQKVVWPTLPT